MLMPWHLMLSQCPALLSFSMQTFGQAVNAQAQADSGVEHCINSDGILELDEVPKRLGIIGGGYIGVEFGGMFNNLGSEVNFFIRGEKLLRGFDEEIRDKLHEEYGKQGIKINNGCDIAYCHYVHKLTCLLVVVALNAFQWSIRWHLLRECRLNHAQFVPLFTLLQ